MTAKSVEPQTVHFTAPLCVAVTPHSRHIDIEPALAHSRACTPRRVDGQIRDVNKDNRPDLPLHYVVAATGIDSGSTSVEHHSVLTAVVPPLRRQSR